MAATYAPETLALTPRGRFVVADGLVYILTPCCEASGKGATAGIVCRACYRPVGNEYGWAALASDVEGTRRDVESLLSGAYAPGNSPELIADMARAIAELAALKHSSKGA